MKPCDVLLYRYGVRLRQAEVLHECCLPNRFAAIFGGTHDVAADDLANMEIGLGELRRSLVELVREAGLSRQAASPSLALIRSCRDFWRQRKRLLESNDYNCDIDDGFAQTAFGKLRSAGLRLAARVCVTHGENWFRLEQVITDFCRLLPKVRPMPVVVFQKPEPRTTTTLSNPPWAWCHGDEVRRLVDELGQSVDTLLPPLSLGDPVAGNLLAYAGDHIMPFYRVEIGLRNLAISAGVKVDVTGINEASHKTAANEIGHRESSELWAPTKFQTAILKALEGIALRADGLAEVLHTERRKLFGRRNKAGPLKELINQGLVRHSDRLGYYLPNSPPPAAFHKCP